MHGLSRTERLALKASTRRLVDQVGGVEAAEACCRLSRSSIARQYSPHHTDSMPIDVVRELEAAGGLPTVTATLARLMGYTLVPIEVEPGAPELLRRLGELMRDSGALFVTGADALDDGVITDQERQELLDRLHQVRARVHSAIQCLGPPETQPKESGMEFRESEGT